MGGTRDVPYFLVCNAACVVCVVTLAGCKLTVRPSRVGTDAAAVAFAWANTFEAGVEAIKFYGGADVGYRTMLDALLPASAALKSALTSGSAPMDALAAAVSHVTI